LDWRGKVELFEEIRREYEFGIGTIVGVAKKLGVHRRMVREAIGSALPSPRKRTERPRWKLKAAVEFVDTILEADRRAPRKQRHTAHRIWERIQSELPDCKIAERTVREYVHTRKITLGLVVREVCVPQSYVWGVEAQIDWYEAYADLAGERVKLQVFAMRSMASGAAFHRAYLHATQQAFLEAHELAFAYFGGVFRKLRYDNLASAVKKILRGSRREETARFVALRSHWRFEAEFCTPAEPHEKGGIEGEAGYFRRNHWVPVPEAVDVAELNRRLLAACQQDEHRLIGGRLQTVGTGLLIEREHLLPLVTEGIDLAQTSFPTVNGLGCAKVLTNAYSTPLPAGTQVQAKAYASTVELWHDGRCVARHERCYGRQQQILDLEHFLDVLYRKPGALAGSKPLEQRRLAGLWPPSFDRIWQALIERHGKQSGTRQMIDLLKLSQKHGHSKLQQAIESALAGNCYDAAAVQHLLNAEELRHASCETIDVGALERYARPLPVMHEYDQLLLTVGGSR
jgi:transposase